MRMISVRRVDHHAHNQVSIQVKDIKALLSKYGSEKMAQGIVDRQELENVAIDFLTKSLPDLLADKYDLVANITHERPADVGREGKHDPLEEGMCLSTE